MCFRENKQRRRRRSGEIWPRSRGEKAEAGEVEKEGRVMAKDEEERAEAREVEKDTCIS